MDDDLTGNEDERKEKSSAPILAAIFKAEEDFNDWQATCANIDEIYSLGGLPYGGYGAEAPVEWYDAQLDLFWASYEVLKPAVYARVPVPAVSAMFKDNKALENTTAELLERASISVFERANLHDVMCLVRDDLLFSARGVLWCRYDTDDGQDVCIDHVDRTDFVHEPARYWSEIGWGARRCWMTEAQVKARFKNLSKDQLDAIQYKRRRGRDTDSDFASKAAIWEVWHKADKRVYWVTEGVDTYLDESDPEVKLKNFFPFPRPAYGTLKRRTLIPVPDWERYAIHFNKISDLTARIYSLLNAVKMKGIVAGGGDVADAVDEILRSEDDQVVIRVSTMAADASNLVTWLPLAEVATAIQGLIEARSQLISDFYELSGISDIMRGATEADETLGAQQLKGQYGSVRIREKVDEMQRIAADATRIAAEIIAEHFTKDNLLKMAQMEIPTSAEIKKRVKEVEDSAKKEMEALTARTEETIEQARAKAEESGQQDPNAEEQLKAQVQQQFQQGQQEIAQKYGKMFAEAQSLVPIEDVMKLLRDDRARSFAFEIETDSTVLTDELQEKASRNEFLQQFTNASQGLMQMSALGAQGAELAGALMKFVLAPYRAGRQLDDKINAFIDAAPQMAQAAQGQGGEDASLAEANNKLAEAEQIKAQAAMEGVKAKAAKDNADMQAKMTQFQIDAANDAAKDQQEQNKLRLQLADMQESARKQDAEIDHLRAQTAEILARIGLDVRKQDLEEYKVASGEEQRVVDNVMRAQDTASDIEFRERDAARADNGDQRADRQQAFAEQGNANGESTT